MLIFKMLVEYSLNLIRTKKGYLLRPEDAPFFLFIIIYISLGTLISLFVIGLSATEKGNSFVMRICIVIFLGYSSSTYILDGASSFLSYFIDLPSSPRMTNQVKGLMNGILLFHFIALLLMYLPLLLSLPFIKQETQLLILLSFINTLLFEEVSLLNQVRRGGSQHPKFEYGKYIIALLIIQGLTIKYKGVLSQFIAGLSFFKLQKLSEDVSRFLADIRLNQGHWHIVISLLAVSAFILCVFMIWRQRRLKLLINTGLGDTTPSLLRNRTVCKFALFYFLYMFVQMILTQVTIVTLIGFWINSYILFVAFVKSDYLELLWSMFRRANFRNIANLFLKDFSVFILWAFLNLVVFNRERFYHSVFISLSSICAFSLLAPLATHLYFEVSQKIALYIGVSAKKRQILTLGVTLMIVNFFVGGALILI